MATSPAPQQPASSRAVVGEDVISACNRLVTVLHDAADGWRVAADAVGNDDLAEELHSIASRRERFASQLDDFIFSRSRRTGTEPNRHARLLTWRLEARAAVSHGDRAAILRVCRLGNRATIEEYADVLEVAMPETLRRAIVCQANEVRRKGDWLSSID